MHWTDINDIALELDEKYPEQDPLTVNFVDLQAMVMGLDDFSDNSERCNEKILEAIQMEWIKERE